MDIRSNAFQRLRAAGKERGKYTELFDFKNFTQISLDRSGKLFRFFFLRTRSMNNRYPVFS
jgi:hypothetical protein